MKRSPALLLVSLLLAAVSLLRAADVPALPDGLYAEFATPRGTITCELFLTRAPLTVTSFVGLAEGTLAPRDGRPFYTGLKWYRVVPNFVIQSGDPTYAPNKPDSATADPYSFPDEFVPGLHLDTPGILAMANDGPDTNGCEFFITLRDTTRLNYLHSVFGRVVRGHDVLPQIKPDDPFTIKILRLGAAAKKFRADQPAFAALLARAKKYSFAAAPGPAAHFDDPDKLLPADPPRAKNFNFKLANFERATGVKIYARVFAKFTPETPAQRPGNFAGSLAHRLGLAQDGILAIYFADTGKWGLWIGDNYVTRFMGRPGTVSEFMKDGAFHQAKQDFLAAAKAQADTYTAEAEKSAAPGKPITASQKIKYSTDAVLDALLLKLEPK